jgi:putative spermidine/putrescine transport system ATP-binding protein
MHISRQLGATVIYVTHDQEEALVMSDRIAIFRDGRIEQLGSGEDLYDRPASLFVADFMGESNIFRGRFERGPDGGRVVGDGWTARVGSGSVVGTELTTGSTVALVVRPEKLDVRPAGSAVGAGEDALPATVRDVLFLGAVRKYELTLADGKPAVGRAAVGPGGAAAGDEVLVAWRVDDAVVVADPMR